MLFDGPIEWLKRGEGSPQRGGVGASAEAVTLRCISVLVLAAFVVKSFTTTPYPGLTGHSALLLVAVIAFVIAAIAIVVVFAASASRPRVEGAQVWLIGLLALLTASSSALVSLQPNGSWQLGPALVGCFSAIGLGRAAALRTFGLAALALLVAGAFQAYDKVILPVLIFDALPWFVVFRLLREIRAQHNELEASQVAEARAAASAERGRLAREMHDVLAHSLSALALQLESTRLLARDRSTDSEVSQAIEKAHHLAANGLQEARRAIATARGDELPGPERIGTLASAFGEQSGLPVDVEVRGQPRALAPEARLAVYRTAQEALTNVRRHAMAQRVHVRLDYRKESTVLVIEDQAAPGVPPPPAPILTTGGGYGLTGMRERAELLGGQLLAAPTSEGFRVELRLPA